MSVYITPINGAMIIKPRFKVEVYDLTTNMRVDFCTCSTHRAALNFIDSVFSRYVAVSKLPGRSPIVPDLCFEITDLSNVSFASQD